MDRVAVPFVNLDEKIDSVLRRMAKADTSCVVTGGGASYRMLDVDAMVYAHRQIQSSLVGDIKSNIPIVSIDDIGSDVNILSERALTLRAQDRLDAQSTPFGLIGIIGDNAILLSRHEGLADAYVRRSTQLWLCIDNGHYLRAHELTSPGDICGYHGSRTRRV